MNAEECRQVLGVPQDAGPEAIRRAYLDLARVWHPDRFQSDERLRIIAEEHLQQINQAYTALKSGRATQSGAGAAGPAGPAAATRQASEEPQQPPRPVWNPPRRRHGGFRLKFRRPENLSEMLLVGILVAAPFLAAAKIVPLLAVPVFDADLVASRAWRPRILTPMQSIDASSDVHTAADALTEWARGDAVDLWKPSGVDAPAAPAATRSTPAAPRLARAHAEPKRPTPPPANGEELVSGSGRGAGELRLSNRSDLEALVKLAQRNGLLEREVYIAPGSSATIRSIGVGVYYLYVDLGHDLDTEHLRFGSNRFTPAPLGPFDFGEITSESGVSGNRFEVVLNPR